jgi:hypothetical protein
MFLDKRSEGIEHEMAWLGLSHLLRLLRWSRHDLHKSCFPIQMHRRLSSQDEGQSFYALGPDKFARSAAFRWGADLNAAASLGPFPFVFH